LRKKTQKELGTRTELKNLNSFRFVEKAINYEIERQSDVLEQGRKIIQETRLYDSDLDETRSMRNKEEANDYRYFPDPDLLPIEINKDYISELAKNLPELPDSKQKRFLAEYQIKNSDIEILISNRYLADFFEQVTKTTNSNPQTVSNWVIGDLSAVLNRDGLDISMTKVSAQALSDLLDRIQDNTISGKIAKEVFNVMWSEGRAPEEIISSQGLVQITDDAEIESVVDVVIKSNPSQFGEYCAGKEKLLGFFVGQVMKKTDGKANPTQVNEILKRKLKLRNT
jgi:aspartyl-tRNA(Asn)/glutamyl-tRNA(Gln) amidotransferase subunit B